jgi:hypothetical protein
MAENKKYLGFQATGYMLFMEATPQIVIEWTCSVINWGHHSADVHESPFLKRSSPIKIKYKHIKQITIHERSSFWQFFIVHYVFLFSIDLLINNNAYYVQYFRWKLPLWGNDKNIERTFFSMFLFNILTILFWTSAFNIKSMNRKYSIEKIYFYHRFHL